MDPTCCIVGHSLGGPNGSFEKTWSCLKIQDASGAILTIHVYTYIIYIIVCMYIYIYILFLLEKPGFRKCRKSVTIIGFWGWFHGEFVKAWCKAVAKVIFPGPDLWPFRPTMGPRWTRSKPRGNLEQLWDKWRVWRIWFHLGLVVAWHLICTASPSGDGNP